MEFQAEDIPKMCRICLKLKESFFLVPINAKLEEGSITELIRSCSNVDLLISDLLPTKICHQCLEQLRIAKEIKQRCTSSEANLKSFLNKNTSISSNAAPEFVNVIKSEENIDKPVFITREQESGHQSEDDKFRMHDFGDTPSVGSVTEPTAKLLQRARTLKIVIPKLDHRIDAGYDQMQFECHYCQELLPNRTHFLKHFALKHKSKRINHKCLLCGLHFRYKTGLTVHMKYHRNERNFKCQLCPRKYVMKIELTKHMKAHSSSDLVVCDKCYRIYNCNYFKKHKCKGTGLIKNDKSIIADLLVQYTCDQCGLEISGKQFLLKHIKRTHMVKELKKLHACTTCGKQFISGYDLTIHRRTHTGKKLLTCPNCGRTFIKQALLERHARSRACSINFSKCKICLKVFKSSKSFKTHQLRCTEEKQQAMKNAPLPVKNKISKKEWFCEFCGTKLSTQASLRRHQIFSHRELINSKPPTEYRCDAYNCDKVFYYKYDLGIHHKRKHEHIKNFPCPHCPKAYALDCLLRLHMKTHNSDFEGKDMEYRCHNCPARYGKEKFLKKHLLKHIANTQYNCTICVRSFPSKKNLSFHNRTKHTE